MQPKFSVIIPVYNAARYLCECLDSVVAQTFTDWEAICVDDGSTDESGAILDEYAAKDSRFCVIHQKNGGEGSARNAGLRAARGDVIAWVDADDLLDCSALQEVQSIFNREMVDMVRMRHRNFSGSSCPVVLNQRHDIEKVYGATAVQKWAVQTLVHEGYCWLTFIRREKFSRAVPVGVQYAEDMLFTLANVSSLRCIVQSEYVGYYYRDTPGSVMKKAFPSAERVCFFREFKAVATLYGKHDQFSRAGWFNLVNWCMRPKDVDASVELRRVFRDLVDSGIVKGGDLSMYARLAFVLYVKLGWRWPIRITYSALRGAVLLRDLFVRHSASAQKIVSNGACAKG